MDLEHAVPTTFEYISQQHHESVLIKGSWDNWQSFAALQRNESNPNLWQVCLTLSPETVLFKFVVDNEWLAAPNYPQISDGFGGLNNSLEIKPPKSDATHERDAQENDDQAHAPHSVPSAHASVHHITDLQIDHGNPEEKTTNPTKDMNFDSREGSSTQHARAINRDESVYPTTKVTLSYPYSKQVKSVSVKGSWDGWEKYSHMKQGEESENLHTILDLPAGKFIFKFIVDGKWTHSTEHEVISDGFGGHNNVLTVSAPDVTTIATSEFSDTINSALPPHKSTVHEMKANPQQISVSSSETEEAPKDNHPIEKLASCEDQDFSGKVTPPQGDESRGEQTNVVEQPCEVQTEPEEDLCVDHYPMSGSAENLKQTSVSPNSLEMIDCQEETTDTVLNHVSKDSSPKTRSPNDTPVTPNSEANDDQNRTPTKNEIGSTGDISDQDPDESSNEHVDRDDEEKPKMENLSDAGENDGELTAEPETNDAEDGLLKKKNSGGCVIC